MERRHDRRSGLRDHRAGERGRDQAAGARDRGDAAQEGVGDLPGGLRAVVPVAERVAQALVGEPVRQVRRVGDVGVVMVMIRKQRYGIGPMDGAATITAVTAPRGVQWRE